MPNWLRHFFFITVVIFVIFAVSISTYLLTADQVLRFGPEWLPGEYLSYIYVTMPRGEYRIVAGEDATSPREYVMTDDCFRSVLRFKSCDSEFIIYSENEINQLFYDGEHIRWKLVAKLSPDARKVLESGRREIRHHPLFREFSKKFFKGKTF